MNNPGIGVAADRVNRHDQDLHIGRRRERLHLFSRLAAIHRRIKVDSVLPIQVLEVGTHQPDAGIHTFADRDTRHKDDELREVILHRKLKNGTQINVRLTCAGLHLDIEIKGILIEQLRGHFQTVAVLHPLQIRQDQVTIEHQTIANSPYLLHQVNLQG